RSMNNSAPTQRHQTGDFAMHLIGYWQQVVAPWVRARLHRDARGASLVEYALLVALIAVICIVAIAFVGQSASSKFSNVGSKLGFNTVWLVEHHFREGRSHCSAPEVVHGALSQITENIRLGFGVTLMPHGFTPPARVAEKIATVDVLSKGRVEWGTGRSTPMEQTAFGVDREQSRAMAEDAIKSVVHMWENEYAEWHSEFLDFPKRLVCPKPYQDPHPAPWMAATSDGSAEIAGRQGMGLLSFAIMQPLSRMKKQIDQYRAAAANPEPITRVANNRVAAYTLVHLMDDEKQAEEHRVWDSVWWWYQNLAEFTLEWEFPHFGQEQEDAYFPLLQENAE